MKSGCHLTVASNELGLTVRTVQRWRLQPDGGEDARKGPLTAPANKLDDNERAAVLKAANRPTMRNLSAGMAVQRALGTPLQTSS